MSVNGLRACTSDIDSDFVSLPPVFPLVGWNVVHEFVPRPRGKERARVSDVGHNFFVESKIICQI